MEELNQIPHDDLTKERRKLLVDEFTNFFDRDNKESQSLLKNFCDGEIIMSYKNDKQKYDLVVIRDDRFEWAWGGSHGVYPGSAIFNDLVKYGNDGQGLDEDIVLSYVREQINKQISSERHLVLRELVDYLNSDKVEELRRVNHKISDEVFLCEADGTLGEKNVKYYLRKIDDGDNFVIHDDNRVIESYVSGCFAFQSIIDVLCNQGKSPSEIITWMHELVKQKKED